MLARYRFWSRIALFAVVAVLSTGLLSIGSLPTSAVAWGEATPPIEKGQRILSSGHSFHVFMPAILADMAQKAGIKDHVQLGLSSIGGSRTIQHWNLPDDKNIGKKTLLAGKVDVFTIAPIHLPDEGIENFVKLALEHNPDIRITIQEFWLPFDLYDTTFTQRPKEVDHNALTGEELRKLHAPYFKSMDEHVQELNMKYGKGKTVVYVAPVGQAIIALREKIMAGEAFGLKKQSDLFTDPIGHATPPLEALVAYVHFASIYRRTPVGLPLPAILAKSNNPNWDDNLNHLLQELAWQAVTQHPLSGVKADATK